MLLFDTGKKLEQAFTREQFDALVDVLEKRDGSLATSQELTAVKTELKADIAELRQEIAANKAELKADIAELRQEIAANKAELKADIAELRQETAEKLTAIKTELKADIAEIDARLRETELRLQKEIVQIRSEMQKVKYDMLKWQLGVGLAIIAVVAKGFGWIGF